MKWFKHDCNAHKDEALQDFYDAFGTPTGYYLYFKFLEWAADKYVPGTEPKFRIFQSVLKNYLELSPKKFKKFGEILSKSNGNSFEIRGNFVEIKFSILLKLFHPDSISSSQRPAVGKLSGFLEEKEIRSDDNRNRVEEERPPATPSSSTSVSSSGGKINGFKSAEELLRAIPKATMAEWISSCGDYENPAGFVDEALQDAFGHFTSSDDTSKWTLEKWITKVFGTITRHKEFVAPNSPEYLKRMDEALTQQKEQVYFDMFAQGTFECMRRFTSGVFDVTAIKEKVGPQRFEILEAIPDWQSKIPNLSTGELAKLLLDTHHARMGSL